jgi:hypothetical protein
VNDQHLPYRVGDHVTLTDTRYHPNPIPLIVHTLTWDAHDGTYYATLTWPNGTGRITRRVDWLHKGWPNQ